MPPDLAAASVRLTTPSTSSSRTVNTPSCRSIGPGDCRQSGRQSVFPGGTDADGREHEADSQAEVTVPGHIQGVLMARIDRLPEEAKRLLQTASVLGREFSPRLLAGYLGWNQGDGTAPHGAQTPGVSLRAVLGKRDPVYVFKHALTQDVAYTSLLTRAARRCMPRPGRPWKRCMRDRLEEAYDRLAYHYAQTDEAAKAVEYLSRFAEQAMARYAREEAVTILQEARRHAARLLGEARDRHWLDLAHTPGEILA